MRVIRGLGVVLACSSALRLAAQTTQVPAPATQAVATTAPATAPTTRVATTAPAATEPSTRPAVVLGDPAELLRRLADPDWHVRRKTQDLLVRGGQEAKPFIQGLIDQATVDEARKNAQAALAEIDQNRAIGPSYITLHVKDASAAEVFAEISRQCFAPLLTFPDNLWQDPGLPRLTLDIDRQVFWKVIPDICQKLGVEFRPYQTGMRLMRGGGMMTGGISTVQGPFLVMANQLNFSRTRSFAGHGDQTQCNMSLTVFAEPKLNVLRGGGMVQLDEAVDDHGNSLVPQNAGAMRVWGGFMGFGGWNLNAPLEYPIHNPGTRIVKFRGSTTFVVQTESQKIEIPDIQNLKQMSKVIGQMPVTLVELKKNGDGWQLRIHVNQPNFGGPEWQQLMEGVQNRLQLLDADGNVFDHRGLSTTSNNNLMDLLVEFGRGNRPDGRPVGDPFRLAWEVPTKTRDVTVPIEFKDLPMFDDK